MNYSIVSYAANHEVIIRVIIAPTTFSDKFKPFPVVCVKFKNFPFRKNALKFITIQPSLLFTTNKALTIFFSLFTYLSQIKSFPKIEEVAGMDNVGIRNGTVG